MSTQVQASRPNQSMTSSVVSQHAIQIRDLIYRVAGIFHAGTRIRFLEDRCERRMQALGVSSMREYSEFLALHPDRTRELHLLLNEITVSETSFFRNQPQLDAFQRIVLPHLAAGKANQPLKHLRIWSAGCSTGEEPYTLAMICLEEAANGALRDCSFDVVATDLNERSIAVAQQGSYSEYSVRNMTALYRNKYLVKEADAHRVHEVVRSRVRFTRANLLEDTPAHLVKGVDVIFCCNVLIYFDADSKRRMIQRFYNGLAPDSYLFLGHSESLFGLSDDFRLVHFPGATGYMKPAQREAV